MNNFRVSVEAERFYIDGNKEILLDTKDFVIDAKGSYAWKAKKSSLSWGWNSSDYVKYKAYKMD